MVDEQLVIESPYPSSLLPTELVQIEFTEWTPDGHLRHSRFVGLREDKNAREVVREG